MTFQAKPHYLPEDLRDYRAPGWEGTQYALAFVAFCLAVVAYVEPIAAPPAVSSSAFPPTQPAVAASMPAAVPIFEARPIPLSSPVQCSGKRNKRGWISHAGDRTRTGRRCV